MLQVQGVFKSYTTPQGPLAVLAGVDLHLAARSSLALMGESGSGKSTLMHLVAGLDRVDDGSIQVGERRLDRDVVDRAAAIPQLADARMELSYRGVNVISAPNAIPPAFTALTR